MITDRERWKKNNLVGSRSTADRYDYWLGRYCADQKMKPAQIVAEAKRDVKAAEDRLQDWVAGLGTRGGRSGKGMAGKTANLALSSVKSWLNFNRVTVQRVIKIRGTTTAGTVEEERPPTRRELLGIIGRANARAKAAISLVAHSGLRPEEAANLRMSHLKLGEPRPIRACIPPDMPGNKARVRYFTFLSGYVLAYLKHREKEGGKLMPESKVLEGAVDGEQVSRWIRHAFKKAGFSGRPYVLRSYFDLACDSAKIRHSRQQFFMGHKGDIEMTYTLRKELPPEKVAELREDYKRVERFL